MIIDALCNVHCHLREGPVISPLIKLAIIGGADTLLPMPNTTAGLKTAEDVMKYIEELRGSYFESPRVNFIPTLMITPLTTMQEIYRCVSLGIKDAKVYPLNRTTKSENGVRHYGRLLKLFKCCGDAGMKIHVHPEHPWMTFDNREAEYQFLAVVDIILNETNVHIIWEHGTDGRCIPFWKEMATSDRFYVTLTAHHLATNEDATFGDVRAVCKPSIKTRRDKEALVQLVEEDHTWVMAGGDDAAHDVKAKHVHEGRCACGAYTAPFLLPLYAHALDSLLQKPEGEKVFQNFTSRNARQYYGLQNASKRYVLVWDQWEVPTSYEVGPWTVEPFWAGKKINFRIEPA